MTKNLRYKDLAPSHSMSNIGPPSPPLKTGEFWCESANCAARGRLRELPWRNSDQYPFCPECGKIMRENISAPGVIWTGPITSRYRDRDKPGFHGNGTGDGMVQYTRKTPDGKPKPVFLENWSDVKTFCRSEGLEDPRSMGRNMTVSEDGRTMGYDKGAKGTEI